MDFDQWKPLTGRGDPLRKDPTYDYEPPVLERVHYWADDTRLEREHYPERKSEVLMLGVSSRKPSVNPRQPPLRRLPRPTLNKYEDFSYKFNDHYPMTILVPPPPPPPGHQPSLYVFNENKIPMPKPQTGLTETPEITRDTTPATEQLTSLYALQESNLVYQSSSTSQNWIFNLNQTKPIPNAVSTDYAGWGPTTPLNDNDSVNDTHNLIANDHIETSKHVYSFYKPMLSEAPPPPYHTTNSIFSPTFVPTALPPTDIPPVLSVAQTTKQEPDTTTEFLLSITDYLEETTTPTPFSKKQHTAPDSQSNLKIEKTMLDMLGPMMSMPMVNGPERPEDKLYAHASENVQVYKEQPTEDTKVLETMQTMQPPPPNKLTETATEFDNYRKNPVNKFIHKKPSKFTLDPYLHMRFTTSSPIITTDGSDEYKSTTEAMAVPMYLIIQGHSKVKTYSSKPDLNINRDTKSNEIPKINETTEVKHLHPVKENKSEKSNTIRESRSKNLKTLVEDNYGSIEIQEADMGIQYDVSDGSNVPLEMYRRGIVETDENDYSSLKKNRTKRQIDFEDLLPFDEDAIEEYVFNFLNGKRNSTGITGLIAQAITGDAASEVDDLEDDDDSSIFEEER
ncbi:unnamed protein product [Diatraea saccharalis]|uniref:Uncharacterized protein n=1 Tax=Diatraea saccharalis TaxID=40085 RepID=A0A9N9W8H1_9NEOP|nr:unnamed protein product [Diatraea saccharalis]